MLKSPSGFNRCIYISPYLTKICYKGEEYYHSLDTYLLAAFKKTCTHLATKMTIMTKKQNHSPLGVYTMDTRNK